MKCCVCGAPVPEEKTGKYLVEVENTPAVACSAQHRTEASQHPESCKLNAETCCLTIS